MKSLPAPADDWAIFLDVDGTLIEIAEHPEAVRPARYLPTILQELAAALDGAVALVSGRSIAAVDRLTNPLELTVAGLHGLELRTADGRYQGLADEYPEMAWARRRLQAFADDHAGLYLEDKTATLALHYRGAPAAGPAAMALGRAIVHEAGGRLALLAGKSVLELKPAEGDKGRALHKLLASPPFRGRRPVYVGDDTTDEHGFAAANELDGVSIRVGDSRESAARYQLDTVDEVLQWLQRVTATLTAAVRRPT